ncbi:MAG: bifunctional DNA-formamidopyrimidine glycosylase/DNA-(apurinic or apyrimidinic site) lyase [Chloroflexaceae bacterium]|nr:bifunctional DNA-formamidopyrimidine glycosylase/DNA-(apurinic or apyrimidinic site) lyase [Chloroflexaceae bacterium]
MPELPEVEITARDMAAQINQRSIVAIEKLDWERMVETPTIELFRATLPGRQIIDVGRRAKWVLFTLDAGWTMTIHLRMSGRLFVHPPEVRADEHTHLVLALDDGRRLFFHDTRKFGRVNLLDADGLTRLSQRYGPEPLSKQFTHAVLKQIVQQRSTRLKPLLLDQACIAGLGNIYVDESLWESRLHPLRTAASLSDAEIARLHRAIRRVLRTALDHGGSTLRDYRDGYGQRGQHQYHFSVYQRTNTPCPRCKTPIVRLQVVQRSTHLCPQCQPAPDDTKFG